MHPESKPNNKRERDRGAAIWWKTQLMKNQLCARGSLYNYVLVRSVGGCYLFVGERHIVQCCGRQFRWSQSTVTGHSMWFWAGQRCVQSVGYISKVCIVLHLFCRQDRLCMVIPGHVATHLIPLSLPPWLLCCFSSFPLLKISRARNELLDIWILGSLFLLPLPLMVIWGPQHHWLDWLGRVLKQN